VVLVGASLTVSFATVQMVSAQDKQSAQETIRVNSDLVVLSASVRDRSGSLVPDLKPEQFRIFDDGVEQRIDVFADEGLPLSLVILVDNDLNGNEGVQMVQSLRALVGGISLQDEVTVCRFDMLFYAGDGFTSDPNKLMADLKSAQAEIKPTPKYVPQPVISCTTSTTGPPCLPAPSYLGSRPSKALDDAVFSAAGLLQSAGSDHRKIILLVSDGVNEPKLNKHGYESVREKLLLDNISVFSLAVGSDTHKAKFSRLENYANVSGGDIYYASRSSTLERIYSRITEQARHQYTLAYIPTGMNRSSNYHRIEIRVAREGLTVQTREGYYSNPPAEPAKQ
jgi:Ca-activated chloride channel family protein